MPHVPDSALQTVVALLVRAAQLQQRAVDLLEDSREALGPAARPGPRPATPVPLTPRETDVLGLLGQGLSNDRIAAVLGISPHTVRAHMHSIFRKLGANQRTEAMVLAMRAGLLEGPSHESGFSTGAAPGKDPDG